LEVFLSSPELPRRPYLLQVSPATRLGRPELTDVIGAARYPLVGSAVRKKALHRTLKTLADWMVVQAAEAPRLPQEDVRAIAAAFQKLRKVFRHDPYAPNSPPQMPEGWGSLMEQWIAEETTPKTAGAPIAWFDQFSYPKLLGFFEVAYGRKHGVTLNGPAHRFLISFFEHLQADVHAHYTDRPDVKARVHRLCTSPSSEVLRHRLRTMQPDTEWIGQVVTEHEAALAEYDPPNHW
jgi:hypothetical protein